MKEKNMTNFITEEEVLNNWQSDDKPVEEDPVFIQYVANTNAFTEYKFPNLATKIEEQPEYFTTLVKMVLARVIIRAWNGSTGLDTGLTGYSFTDGPFSQSGSIDSSKAEKRGTIYFTEEDYDILKDDPESTAFRSISFKETAWSSNNPISEPGDLERFSSFGYNGVW